MNPETRKIPVGELIAELPVWRLHKHVRERLQQLATDADGGRQIRGDELREVINALLTWACRHDPASSSLDTIEAFQDVIGGGN